VGMQETACTSCLALISWCGAMSNLMETSKNSESFQKEAALLKLIMIGASGFFMLDLGCGMLYGKVDILCTLSGFFMLDLGCGMLYGKLKIL
jgi:hypothetical protein